MPKLLLLIAFNNVLINFTAIKMFPQICGENFLTAKVI